MSQQRLAKLPRKCFDISLFPFIYLITHSTDLYSHCLCTCLDILDPLLIRRCVSFIYRQNCMIQTSKESVGAPLADSVNLSVQNSLRFRAMALDANWFTNTCTYKIFCGHTRISRACATVGKELRQLWLTMMDLGTKAAKYNSERERTLDSAT